MAASEVTKIVVYNAVSDLVIGDKSIRSSGPFVYFRTEEGETLHVCGKSTHPLTFYKGNIYENYLPAAFSGVKTSEISRECVARIRLRHLELSGTASLMGLSGRAVDGSCVFSLTVRDSSRVRARLPLSQMTCQLHDSASVVGRRLSDPETTSSVLKELTVLCGGRASLRNCFVTGELHLRGEGAPSVQVDVLDGCRIFTAPSLDLCNISVRKVRSGRMPRPVVLRRAPRADEAVYESSMESYYQDMSTQQNFSESYALSDDAAVQPLFRVSGMRSEACVPVLRPADVPCTICLDNLATVLAGCGHAICCNGCADSASRYQAACPHCRQPIAVAIAQHVDATASRVSFDLFGSPREDTVAVDDPRCGQCRANVPCVDFHCGHRCVCLACAREMQQRKAHCLVCRAPVVSAIIVPPTHSSN